MPNQASLDRLAAKLHADFALKNTPSASPASSQPGHSGSNRQRNQRRKSSGGHTTRTLPASSKQPAASATNAPAKTQTSAPAAAKSQAVTAKAPATPATPPAPPAMVSVNVGNYSVVSRNHKAGTVFLIYKDRRFHARIDGDKLIGGHMVSQKQFIGGRMVNQKKFVKTHEFAIDYKALAAVDAAAAARAEKTAEAKAKASVPATPKKKK